MIRFSIILPVCRWIENEWRHEKNWFGLFCIITYNVIKVLKMFELERYFSETDSINSTNCQIIVNLLTETTRDKIKTESFWTLASRICFSLFKQPLLNCPTVKFLQVNSKDNPPPPPHHQLHHWGKKLLLDAFLKSDFK